MRKGMVFLSWSAALVWMWAIFYFSALPEEAVPPGISLPGYISDLPLEKVPQSGTWLPDYMNHGAAYFLLAFLLFIAWQRTFRSSFTIAFGAIVGWCLIFGLGNEINQHYLPTGRHFSWWDLLADGVGAAILFLFLLALKKAGGKGKRVYSLLGRTDKGEAFALLERERDDSN